MLISAMSNRACDTINGYRAEDFYTKKIPINAESQVNYWVRVRVLSAVLYISAGNSSANKFSGGRIVNALIGAKFVPRFSVFKLFKSFKRVLLNLCQTLGTSLLSDSSAKHK